MKLLSSLKFSSLALVLTALSHATHAVGTEFTPSEDGLFAVFTTNQGEFTAKLYFDQAPITVANFVGLAEGSVLRWDEDEKEPVWGPYYDGVIFHRVIDEFVIQGGDPTGTGTGGPGYPIPDEIVPGLSHDRAGILSMAKSGANTGGSQFFITLDAGAGNFPTHLDGNHSIFGEIVAGLDNVEAIGDVPVDTSNKPTTDVIIETITILRVGDAAASFNPRDYDVPNVFFPEIDFDPAAQAASFSRKKYASYYIRQSTDLVDWELDESVVADLEAPDTHELDLSSDFANNEQSFLRVSEVTNVHSLDAVGTEITLSLEANDDIAIKIEEDFSGTYTFGDSEGSLAGYIWYPLVDRDQLYIGFLELNTQMQVYLTWTSETEGTVFARVTYPNTFNLTGTFTANARPSDD